MMPCATTRLAVNSFAAPKKSPGFPTNPNAAPLSPPTTAALRSPPLAISPAPKPPIAPETIASPPNPSRFAPAGPPLLTS